MIGPVKSLEFHNRQRTIFFFFLTCKSLPFLLLLHTYKRYFNQRVVISSITYVGISSVFQYICMPHRDYLL